MWLRNIGTRRKRKKLGSVPSATNRDTLQKTAKRNSQ